jgi:hypothetical protein
MLVSGSDLRELIACEFDEQLQRLIEAARPRAPIGAELRGKTSPQAEALLIKQIRHGEIPPDQWRSEADVREQYRRRRTYLRRETLSLIDQNERPLMLEIIDGLMARLGDWQRECEDQERAFFKDFGLDCESRLAAPFVEKRVALEAAKEKLVSGSYHDIANTMTALFGREVADPRSVDDEQAE